MGDTQIRYTGSNSCDTHTTSSDPADPKYPGSDADGSSSFGSASVSRGVVNPIAGGPPILVQFPAPQPALAPLPSAPLMGWPMEAFAGCPFRVQMLSLGSPRTVGLCLDQPPSAPLLPLPR